LFFFVCDWFEPNGGVRENQYGMVEVKHNESSRETTTGSLHTNVTKFTICRIYPNQKLHAWWVVHKVNPRECLYTPRQVGYYSQFDDEVDEVFQEEELPTSFVIEPGVKLNFLVGDSEDINFPNKRKRNHLRKKFGGQV